MTLMLSWARYGQSARQVGNALKESRIQHTRHSCLTTAELSEGLAHQRTYDVWQETGLGERLRSVLQMPRAKHACSTTELEETWAALIRAMGMA